MAATAEPEIKLDMDTPSGLPAWATSAIAALARAKTVDEIAALIAPIRAQPEGPAKNAVRAAKDAAHARVRAVYRAALLSTLALVWARLWGSLSAAIAARPPGGQSLMVPISLLISESAPTVIDAHKALRTGVRQRPYSDASYTKLRNGDWGARIKHTPWQPVSEGAFVLVTRKNGSKQLHTVTHVHWTDGTATLVGLGDAPANRGAVPVTVTPTLQGMTSAEIQAAAHALAWSPLRDLAQAHLAAPQTVASVVQNEIAHGAAPALATNQTIRELTEAEASGTVESALASVAIESTSNAAVQSAGSLAGGQLRGVGFSSADGYVTALRNGVKQATADSYKSILSGRFGYTTEQIAALTVTIIPEVAALPVGQGITHGPANSDAGIAAIRNKARARLTPHGRATVAELRQQVRETLGSSQLIAGLMTERALLQWSWVGGGQTTRGRVVEALAAIGREDHAPGAPSAVRYAGDAVDSLRSREYDCKRLASADLSDGVKARWLVGRALTGTALAAGASYGEALLIVSLHDDGSLSFEGDATLAQAVRSHFDRSTAHETLRSDVLTAWLGKILKNWHHAVKRGAAWYVPAAEREAAQQLCDAISPLWGDHETISVTAESDVSRVLSNGIRAEITRVGEDVATAITESQERARVKAIKDNLNPEIAARRATLTIDKSAALTRQVALVASRLEGFSGVLDETERAALRTQLTATQRMLSSVGADDSIARAAMLELD